MAMEFDEWRDGEGKGGREGFSLASVEGKSHGEQGKPSEISPQRLALRELALGWIAVTAHSFPVVYKMELICLVVVGASSCVV